MTESRTYRVVHRTTFSYSALMTDGYTVAVLVPRPTPWQEVLDSQVTMTPTPSEVDSYLDPFGNLVTQFGLHEPHRSATVEAVSALAVTERPRPVDDTPWEQVVATLDAMTGDDAVDIGFLRGASTFVKVDELGLQLSAMARESFTPGRPMVEAVADLCNAIFDHYDFDANFSELSTPLAAVLDQRRGVCQDFAHVAVGCLRSIGLAARYVSGYIETVPEPGQPRLVGADASHAWCSVWTPQAGWVDFDPTNGHLPPNHHVTVAWGRDYADVTPVRGVMIGPATSQTLEVSVDVAPS